MKKLENLIEDIDLLNVVGSLDKRIDNLEIDSRKVQSNSLFAAMPGSRVDGHRFIPSAIERGASVVLLEQLPQQISDRVSYLQVENVREALGVLADRFYERPSRQLRLVGVTGTNGKTTTVTLLHDLFTGMGYKCGMLSTIENRIGQSRIAAELTTPDVVNLHRMLREMADAQCDFAFMEVSSHATVQRRIAGAYFSGAVFTNISHDHLDYHGTFQAYIEAKKSFFDGLEGNAFALTNIDDKRGRIMVQNTRASVRTISARQLADYRVKIIENGIEGLQLRIDEQEVFCRLIGSFNAYNLLAAYAVARELQQEPLQILAAISTLTAAEGRFERLIDAKSGRAAVVDYAHTPDALEKVLDTLVELRSPGTRIITVVGCGGDRDRSKRPKMAAVAGKFSDLLLLTSDNPRSEDPEVIIDDMEAGLPERATLEVFRNSNRREAIRMAVRLAREGDVILVAGKGHEKYQEINGVKHPFDDKEILKEEFSR